MSFVVFSFYIFCFLFFVFFFFLLSCFLLLLPLCLRGLIANDGIKEKLIIQYQYSGGFICDFNRFSAAQRLLKKVIVTESVAPLDDKMPAVDVVGNDEGENRVVRRLDQISLFRCITLRI